MELLDNYIRQLVEKSTPEASAWNIEKVRSGKKSTWNYIDGCMIKALLELYRITGDKTYLDFSDNYIDYFVEDDGSIKTYSPEDYSLDSVNEGKTLFDLYELTRKEKYRLALDLIHSQLMSQPRTKSGVFWHKKGCPNQVWLDGLYMAQPFYLRYELDFNGGINCDDVFNQFRAVKHNMQNPLNGLYYHAIDESRERFWCDKATGLSNQVWLRAEGWFAMALADTIELLPERYGAEKEELSGMFRDLVDAMLPYQDKECGMWRQIINFPGIKPNYPEASGSSMFAYAIMKGARLGILDASCYEIGRRAFDGVVRTCISEEKGELQLTNICLVAGLGNKTGQEGTFGYYMTRPVVKNDAKGVAPLVFAYIETLLHKD